MYTTLLGPAMAYNAPLSTIGSFAVRPAFGKESPHMDSDSFKGHQSPLEKAFAKAAIELKHVNLAKINDKISDERWDKAHQKINKIKKTLINNLKEVLENQGYSKKQTSTLAKAIKQSFKLHKNDRYSKKYPYALHLVKVAQLVARANGSLEALEAAFLHDTVDDHGTKINFKSIEKTYGKTVAKVVEACSYDALKDVPTQYYENIPKDKKELKDEAWFWKQLATLKHMEESAEDPAIRQPFLLVKMADTAHGLEASWKQIQKEGETHWNIFRIGKEGQLWKNWIRIGVYKHSVSPHNPILEKINRDFKNSMKHSNTSETAINNFYFDMLSKYGNKEAFTKLFNKERTLIPLSKLDKVA